MRLLLLVIHLIVLLGCNPMTFMEEPPAPPERTLADLEPIKLDTVSEVPQTASLEELAQIYRDVLVVADDASTRDTVKLRLADIQMLLSEEQLLVMQADPDVFADAIIAYETLLAQRPGRSGNDRLLYQLSKAYDLRGMSEKSFEVMARLAAGYPKSIHFSEAEFRLAERNFANAEYVGAERSYSRVIAIGQNTPYYLQALYMQGWSRFKQGQLKTSIVPFTATLDLLMPLNEREDTLSRGERELLEDCFRIMAVVFSSLAGPDSIAAAYEALGERPYQHRLYQALGEHYLAQQRYRDSAETYRAYTREFPTSPLAHQFALRVVQSYEAGGFPDLIIEEKRNYVIAFGVGGEYWLNSAVDKRREMAVTLRVYITELASYYHALARAADARETPSERSAEYYGRATDYYQRFVDSFPNDPGTANMAFLLAESRLEVGDYTAAITAFDWVAYRFADFDRAADAAHAAIVAHDLMAVRGAPITAARIDSELRFAAFFADDKRAPSVLAHAANALLDNGHYQQAIIAAATLAHWNTDAELEISARLIVAHSHFELQQFQSAEQSYQAAMEPMSARDDRQAETLQRVAETIYRQGESAAEQKNFELAAAQFSRVIEVAPQSKIRIAAQYDAAANFILAGQVSEANRLLVQFRQRYPEHPLSASIAASLVENYLQLEDWVSAAAELDTIHAREADAKRGGEALYLAAQNYDRAGRVNLAIERFRKYAHDEAQPLDLRMEAMNRLSELYSALEEPDKQRFWLRKMVASHDGAGALASERSVYLAAMSSTALADDLYWKFFAVKLRQPLRKSIARKKSAMEAALAAYQKSASYGVQQFASLNTFRLGLIYQQMSLDLLASERPANLDPLALEQYELLMEEQAYPFEEKAIAIWEANARRSWEGVYDEWVRASFAALAEVSPGRYRKTESIHDPNLEFAVYNVQAISLREEGRFREAEQRYLSAIALWEQHPDSHRNLGILYDLYMGRGDQALQHFTRYQSLSGVEDRAVAAWVADLERQLTSLAQEN